MLIERNRNGSICISETIQGQLITRNFYDCSELEARREFAEENGLAVWLEGWTHGHMEGRATIDDSDVWTVESDCGNVRITVSDSVMSLKMESDNFPTIFYE